MTFENLRSIQFNKDQIVMAVTHSPLRAGHLGLCFHSEDDGPKLWHLAWHRFVHLDALPQDLGDDCWIGAVLAVPAVLSRQLVATIRVAAKLGPRINYGLNFLASRGSFNASGEYTPPEGSDGLTCASFVLEVLRSKAVDLVRSETWRESQENVEWAELVCGQLPSVHAAAVRRNINGLRLRPYELAGASQISYQQWPVSFDQVQEPARQVERVLNSVCPAQDH